MRKRRKGIIEHEQPVGMDVPSAGANICDAQWLFAVSGAGKFDRGMKQVAELGVYE